MPKIKIGHYIENRDPNDDLQTRIEKAFDKYMLTETIPPNTASVDPYLLRDETVLIIRGHRITVTTGMQGRWITWIGEGE
jgi:hypothetical protein